MFHYSARSVTAAATAYHPNADNCNTHSRSTSPISIGEDAKDIQLTSAQSPERQRTDSNVLDSMSYASFSPSPPTKTPEEAPQPPTLVPEVGKKTRKLSPFAKLLKHKTKSS